MRRCGGRWRTPPTCASTPASGSSARASAPDFYVLLSGGYDLMKRYGDELRRLAVREAPGRAPRRAADRARRRRSSPARGRPRRCASRASTRAVRRCWCGSRAPLRERIVAAIQNRIEGLESRRRAPGRCRSCSAARTTPSATACATSCRATRCRSSGPTRTSRGSRSGPSWRTRWRRRRLRRGAAARTAGSWCSPPRRELAEGVGIQVEPGRETYDVVVIGGGPTGSRPRCTAPRRGCARCWSSARRRRPGGHLDPDRELPRLPERRLGRRPRRAGARAGLRLGAEIVVTRSIERDHAERQLPHRYAGRRREIGARAVSSRPASRTARCRRRASTRSSASASSTGPRAPRRPHARPRRDPRRRRQLGRPGGGVLRRLRAKVTILIRGAGLERRCRAT